MEDLTFTDVTEPESLMALAARLARDLGTPLTIRHDPGWIRVNNKMHGAKLIAMLGESKGKILWCLPLSAHPYRMRMAIGPITLWSARVTRLNSRDLRVSESADAIKIEQRIVRALSALRRRVPDDAVLFFESVPENSPVTRAFDQLARLPDGYRALCYGPTYMHRTADISGGLDEYLKRLGSKTRADLRRTRRRFEQAVGTDTELFVAQTEGDLERLVSDVLEVAQTTWQYRQEDAGPHDDKILLEKCREAARKSMLRSYVLYVKGKPIAFQIGYTANGSFDAHEIGYNPAWRKSQPGILLHMGIVEDLGISVPGVTLFDFGVTDRLHKSRLSTAAVEEGFYYLFPNSTRGRLLYTGLRATTVLTDWLKGLRERVQNLANRLKRGLSRAQAGVK